MLSLAYVAVVQPLAGSASYPCLFSGLRQCPLAATYPAPGSYILLAGFDVFPRVRFSVPRVDLATVRVGQSTMFSPRSRRAFSGLNATPEFSLFRASELPTVPTLGSQLIRRSQVVTCVSISLWFSRFACAYRPVSALTSSCSVSGHSQSDGLPHRLFLRS